MWPCQDYAEEVFISCILSSLAWPPSKEILDLQSNDLEGNIPSSLYDLSTLTVFAVSNNTKLGGTVDPRIARLTLLTRWEVGATQVQGTLPDEIFQLERLSDIVVSNADMSGPLKEDIVALSSSLQLLELNGNSFTSPIPTALDAMTALEGLFLHDNLFTGTISDVVCAERGVGFQKLYELSADCNIVCNCNDNPECL